MFIGVADWSVLTLMSRPVEVEVGERLRFDVSPTIPSRPSRHRLSGRDWERDAQVFASVLILFPWTTETFTFLPPPTHTVTSNHCHLQEHPSPQTLVRFAHHRTTPALTDSGCLANAFARRLHSLFPSTQNHPASAALNDSATSPRRRESLPPKFLKVRIVTWNMHDSLPKVRIHLISTSHV